MESQVNDLSGLIEENWNATLAHVRAAAEHADRDPESVRIIGVTKYVDADTTRHLIDAGCKHLGENRPQMLWQKAETLGSAHESAEGPNWHMIGHVQTNKIRRMLRHRPIIHSIDSERLLRALAEESQRADITTDALLEVNISGDSSKTGLNEQQVRELLSLKDTEGVDIIGLMAMAGWGTDEEEALHQFQAVSELRDRLQQEFGRPLKELSMGMSGDYPQAISAGATLVRIGSALFKGVL